MKNDIMLITLDKKEIDNLEVLKKYGKKAAYTDIYLISGGNPNSSDMERVPDEFGLKSRVAPKDETLRLVIDTYSDVFQKLSKNKTQGYNKTYEIELGEYPQYAASHVTNETLENHYQKMLFTETGAIIPTGKTYTIYQNGDLVKYNEYYHDGKRYIRVKLEDKTILSNANTYYKDDYVWIEVSKVKWLIDEETERIISKLVHLPNLDMSYANFISGIYILKDMFTSSMNKKSILEMISYVIQNTTKENEKEYLDLVNQYPDVSLLSQEELEKLLLDISKLNDKTYNFDYELTYKMK